ncbi:hypothetical protein RJ640_000943 [Escallonia rubra]|uniref:Uncharacterized protein n=1 Tax=Escallonia rubra TaxID=112253 RepID=A0AA88UI99_9ASTE|nr:hypothetical protein RJ640_000943 [Escallonia rubra]
MDNVETGFEEGIGDMRPGGKRRIIIPPELGPPEFGPSRSKVVRVFQGCLKPWQPDLKDYNGKLAMERGFRYTRIGGSQKVMSLDERTLAATSNIIWVSDLIKEQEWDKQLIQDPFHPETAKKTGRSTHSRSVAGMWIGDVDKNGRSMEDREDRAEIGGFGGRSVQISNFVCRSAVDTMARRRRATSGAVRLCGRMKVEVIIRDRAHDRCHANVASGVKPRVDPLGERQVEKVTEASFSSSTWKNAVRKISAITTMAVVLQWEKLKADENRETKREVCLFREKASSNEEEIGFSPQSTPTTLPRAIKALKATKRGELFKCFDARTRAMNRFQQIVINDSSSI